MLLFSLNGLADYSMGIIVMSILFYVQQWLRKAHWQDIIAERRHMMPDSNVGSE